MRASHGVENCSTALRKASCSSRGSTALTLAPGMGCAQQRGGILDSSLCDWLTMMRRQLRQYVWPQGSVMGAWPSWPNSSRQHTQELLLRPRSLATCAHAWGTGLAPPTDLGALAGDGAFFFHGTLLARLFLMLW